MIAIKISIITTVIIAMAIVILNNQLSLILSLLLA